MKRALSFFRTHPKTTLVIIIAITALIVYHNYFFGGYVFLFDDIGSDTRQQYIAWYDSIAYHLNQGDFSCWDATYGFGTPMFSLNLFHPTLGILYLIGAVFGAGSIECALIFVHLLHLILAGLGCYLFLASFRLSRRSVFIFSYIYSFNGYLIMWGQHYHFAVFMFYLPLILCLIERSLCIFSNVSAFTGEEAKKQRKRALILIPLVTGVMLLTGFYMSYMIAIVCALYLILRLATLKIRPVKTLLKAFFGRALLFLLGAGIGAVYVLPSYAVIAESSSRLAGGSIIEKLISSMAPWPKEYYMSFFKKLCSSGLEGIGIHGTDYLGYANVYEAPNIFITGLFIILIIQFIIFFPKIVRTLRQRVVIIISLLIIAAICFVPAVSLVFNGFAYPFSRQLFVVIPFMILISAVTLDHLIKNRRFSVIGGLISALFTCVLCVKAIPFVDGSVLKINAAVICVTTVIMVVLLFIYAKKARPGRKALLTALMLLAAVQIISNTYSTVHGRASVRIGSEYFTEVYGENDRELDAYLSENENEYYRLEKTFWTGSATMDSLLQDYRGISGYNSTMNKYVIEFTDKVAPEFRTGPNPNWLTFRELSNRETLYSLFGIKYIVTDEEGSVPSDYKEAAVCGDTYLYEDPEMTFAHFYTESISENAFEEASSVMDKDDILSDYVILNDSADCDITDLSSGVPDIDSALEYNNGAEITIPESVNDGTLDIYIDSDTDGYVFIPITFENGWSAEIDGNDTGILRADYGFMAIETPEGSHVIRLDYTVPYLLPSALVSLVSALIYVLFLIFFIRKERMT